MVSPLLLSKGLRKEENNEKKRKRVKRNEIQCMILIDHSFLFLLGLDCDLIVIFNNTNNSLIFYQDPLQEENLLIQ